MPPLRDFLERSFAERGGVMPFDEFMALALYDPEHGYYTTGITEVGGRSGDFATAATLSKGLAGAVANWIEGERGHHGWKGPVDLIEIGGGNGDLAAGILDALGWWRRRTVRYHLVEVSPILRERQQRRLKRGWNLFSTKERGRPRPRGSAADDRTGPGAAPLLERDGSVMWHDSIAAALEMAGGRALVFSNELVDAFPAKWLCFAEGDWREVWVRYENGALREGFRDRPESLTGESFSALRLADPGEGRRIELHASYREWMRTWVPMWRAGSLLTIDYGAESAGEVYARRPGGTMRGYFRHDRIEGGGVYGRFGRQDLTCDVNFADLVAWGEELGLKTMGLETQARFLERCGGVDDPMGREGPGEAFRVLWQRVVKRV